MFIDCHCHLNFKELAANLGLILGRARAANVSLMVNVGTDVQTSRESIAIARKYPEVYAAVGFHPHEARNFSLQTLSELFVLSNEPKVIAIGEIGLDFFRLERSGKFSHQPTVDQQRRVFEQLIDIAVENGKPVIVHSREAGEAAYTILKSYRPHVNGLFHAYSYDLEFAKKILDLDFYISFAGNLTYPKNESLHQTVEHVPLDRILTETDAPFLPPQSMRGKINEPAKVVEVAEKIAELKRTTVDKIEEAVESNFRTLFRLEN